MSEYVLKLKTGEKQLCDFLRNFAFNIDKNDFSIALENTRKEVRNSYSYKKGLFFKTLLSEMQRDVDWKLAEDLENEFTKILD